MLKYIFKPSYTLLDVAALVLSTNLAGKLGWLTTFPIFFVCIVLLAVLQVWYETYIAKE